MVPQIESRTLLEGIFEPGHLKKLFGQAEVFGSSEPSLQSQKLSFRNSDGMVFDESLQVKKGQARA